MKKYFLIFIFLCMFSCSKNYENFSFYDKSLKLRTPKGWVVYNNTVKTIENPSRTLSLILTSYDKSEMNFNKLQDVRINNFNPASWKKTDLKIDFKSRYKSASKIYKHIDNDYYYIAVPIADETKKKYFLLTFMCDQCAFEKNIEVCRFIVESIRL